MRHFLDDMMPPDLLSGRDIEDVADIEIDPDFILGLSADPSMPQWDELMRSEEEDCDPLRPLREPAADGACSTETER